MKEKNYSQAVEAYKNALRNDPSDDESRYNYALAKKMLKENPPKNDKKKSDKDDKKNKDKDKKNEKDNPNENKKQEKDNKNNSKGENKPDNNGQPKPIPGGISKERLQNLLDAVNNEEKKIQDKVNTQKIRPAAKSTEKDW